MELVEWWWELLGLMDSRHNLKMFWSNSTILRLVVSAEWVLKVMQKLFQSNLWWHNLWPRGSQSTKDLTTFTYLLGCYYSLSTRVISLWCCDWPRTLSVWRLLSGLCCFEYNWSSKIKASLLATKQLDRLRGVNVYDNNYCCAIHLCFMLK